MGFVSLVVGLLGDGGNLRNCGHSNGREEKWMEWFGWYIAVCWCEHPLVAYLPMTIMQEMLCTGIERLILNYWGLLFRMHWVKSWWYTDNGELGILVPEIFGCRLFQFVGNSQELFKVFKYPQNTKVLTQTRECYLIGERMLVEMIYQVYVNVASNYWSKFLTDDQD